MDFDKILQETLEIQRQANAAWAAGKRELLDDGGLTLTVLGCGTMGIAILGGIMHALNNPTSSPGDAPTPEKLPTKFRACVRSLESVRRVQEELGKYNAKLSLFEGENVKAVQGSNVVLLGCKPYMLADLLREEGMREALAGKILISILTGVSVEDLHNVLYPKGSEFANKCTIVRAVPNPAAAVRESMTVIAVPNPPLAAETDALITWMFTRIGRVLRLPEAHMNVCSTLCGSGPAFVAIMAESLVAGAVAMGCPREEARVMAAQTLRGTAALLSVDEDLAVLNRRTSKPNSCTHEGLRVLEDGAVREKIALAVREATLAAGRLGSEQERFKHTE
ncbi:related to Pyrroline-5-carboxylate reductase [Ramularia collo-cygni]|uniref:Related to Pyrroline-5-carboxylate reductase n=1 Tax=Ramularia collo-cygni TaxID=112498 RepID=A0A2D3V1V9_9PEZI|nr:related to Pyrroline-5-carboxylate reductase [Ramularia collo-cygni]CZT20715.1 related to Pyrroline-5-carboxylate reductase [Ramularia collo-cygni]